MRGQTSGRSGRSGSSGVVELRSSVWISPSPHALNEINTYSIFKGQMILLPIDEFWNIYTKVLRKTAILFMKISAANFYIRTADRNHAVRGLVYAVLKENTVPFRLF
jgi:hypothetical protein